MNEEQEVLLDAGDTSRRIAQQALVLWGGAMLITGMILIFRSAASGRLLAAAAVIAGLGLVVLARRILVAWDVAYKGHRIRFENDPIFGERLYIDDRLAGRGGLGYRMMIEGTIVGGEGAGERITSISYADPFRFRCQIVAEPARPPVVARGGLPSPVAPHRVVRR